MSNVALPVLVVTAAILLGLPEAGQTQDDIPSGYVLYRVASAPGGSGAGFKSPTLIEADATGGKVVIQLEHTDKCSETVEFTWTFDTEIRYFKPGQEFVLKLAGKVDGECDPGNDPYASPTTLLEPAIDKTLSVAQRTGLSAMASLAGRTEGQARMGVKSEGREDTRMKVEGVRHAPGLWFGIDFVAATRRERFRWQVAYLYRAVTKTAPPGDIPVTLDTPPKKGGTPTTGPGSGGPKLPPGGTGTPGDPGADPARMACIDRWLDKLVAILNRNAPDRAPWGVSRYGHLVNKQVVSVAPPDGWETRYHGSKHSFVWQEYGNAHRDPLLHGELPPLHEECGGGTGPGGTGGGGTGGGGTGGGGTGGGGTGTGGTGPGGGGVLPTPPGATAATGRTLLAEKRLASPRQTVTVPVRLLNPAGVANINFEVAYDPAVAVARAVTRGSLLAGPALFEANPSQPGRIRVGFADKTGWSADGVVANLTFEVTGTPGTRTPLTLKVTDIDDANDKPLPIALVHGEIIVTGPGGRVPGDCDGDGLVTAADALCALKMSVGLRPVVMTMDVNADQQVTAADARAILQQIP